MAAQDGFLGQLFLLQLSDEGTTPVFTTLGGLKATEFNYKLEAPDVTNKDSAQWKQILGGGISSCTLSGAGVWRNETCQRTAMTVAFAKALRTWKVTNSVTGESWTGKFLLNSVKRSGAHDGVDEYAITLESSGAITVTAGTP
jgi:predicted secreted protein